MSRWLPQAISSWLSSATVQEEDITVKNLWIFPIKSCRGFEVDSAKLSPTGLEHDRQFMLVDAATHKFLTARTIPKMILIETAFLPNNMLSITIPASEGVSSSAHTISLARPTPETHPEETHDHDFHIWGGNVDGYTVGSSELIAALSAYMGRDVLLVQKGEGLREASQHGFVQGLPGVELEYEQHPAVSLADEYPILTVSQESLDDLNRRVQEDEEVHQAFKKQFDQQRWLGKAKDGIEIVRFRGNIVLQGTRAAWEEDTWAEMEIGEDCPLVVAQRCARCQLPNVDPATAIRDPVVPDKFMEKDRHNFPALAQKLTFGVQTVPKRTSGFIRVGDKVTITRRYTDKRPDGTVIRFEDIPFLDS